MANEGKPLTEVPQQWTRKDVEMALMNWGAIHQSSETIFPDDPYQRGLAAGYTGALEMVLRNDAVRPDEPCRMCHGHGVIRIVHPTTPAEQHICPTCKGSRRG